MRLPISVYIHRFLPNPIRTTLNHNVLTILSGFRKGSSLPTPLRVMKPWAQQISTIVDYLWHNRWLCTEPECHCFDSTEGLCEFNLWALLQQNWAVSVYFISSCTKRGCFTDPKCSTELDRRQNVEGMICASTVVPWVDNLFLGDICFFLPQAFPA